MDDDRIVEELLGKGRPAGLTLAGWTYERELLTTIVDVLNQLHATLIQVNSEKGDRPPVDALPRPKTALDRIQAQRAVREHRARVALMRP